MNILIEAIIKENSIFQTISSVQTALKTCAERCRKTIRNNPDYQQQVAVCTTKCKVNSLNAAMAAIERLRGTPGMSEPVLNSKLNYLKARRDKEIMKFTQYKNKLKVRQGKIPVSQSTKPSPERWDPRKTN